MTANTQVEDRVRPLSEAEAAAYIAEACFRTGPVGAVGVEIERIVHDVADLERPVPVAEVRAAVADLESAHTGLPGGGAITVEPGGQLELSSACGPDLPSAITAVRADLKAIDRRIAANGLRFSPLGLDPVRAPVRALEHPRYAAMQNHFDRAGEAGRTMMCSTASLQVCLDAGPAGTGAGSAVARWRRLHELAPVLVAMFANSPFANSPFRHAAPHGEAGVRPSVLPHGEAGVRPSGWASTRQAVWLATDPSRTAPVPPSEDPARSWARYALDASVLCIPAEAGSWAAPRGLTLGGWLGGDGPRPATRADVDYHLSTLFPYVRPRGFLEIRVIDAQAGADWEAVTAITTALVDDEQASDAAAEACVPVTAMSDPMRVAAGHALAEPTLARAGLRCAEAAVGALGRLGVDARTRTVVESFVDRHTARGRCPADERLEHWRRTGELLSTTEDEEYVA